MIAVAIERERRRAGLSLSALAARAGLAKSTLSQLEAGKGNPNIETLWAIASALDIPFSHLFETAAPERTLVRAREGAPIQSAQSAFSTVLLADCPPSRRREIWRVDMEGGKARQAEAHQPGSVEHVFVCEGRVRTGPADAPETLGIGDYFRFSADVAHVYEALSDRAVMLLVMEHPR